MRRVILCIFTLFVFLPAFSITIKPGLSLTESSDTYTIEFTMPDYTIVPDTIIVNNTPILQMSNPVLDLEEFYFSRLKPYGYA